MNMLDLPAAWYQWFTIIVAISTGLLAIMGIVALVALDRIERILREIKKAIENKETAEPRQ